MSAAFETPPFVTWLRRQRRMAWRAILLCSLLRIGSAALATALPSPNPRAEAPTLPGQCRCTAAPQTTDTHARPPAPSNTESNS